MLTISDFYVVLIYYMPTYIITQSLIIAKRKSYEAENHELLPDDLKPLF